MRIKIIKNSWAAPKPFYNCIFDGGQYLFGGEVTWNIRQAIRQKRHAIHIRKTFHKLGLKFEREGVI